MTRANSVGVISVSAEKLTSQVEAARGDLISSQPRRNNHMVQACG